MILMLISKYRWVMKIRVLEHKDGNLKEGHRNVSEEKLFHILVNEKLLLSLFALPNHLEEMVTGFLVSEGVAEYENIEEIKIANCELWVKTGEDIPELKPELRSSGCSGITMQKAPKAVESKQEFPSEMIVNSLEYFKKAKEWKVTGGTHFAALISADGKFLQGFEDVGRHNALDKVIGWALINNHSLADKFVLFTGRLSTGMVMKAARAGIALLVSNTAVLYQAINLADEMNITLVGFARGEEFNAYSTLWRVSR